METENTQKPERDYSEGGKKEVFRGTIRGKELIVAADFDLLRKAHALLTKTTMSKVGNKMTPNVEIDMIAPGDKLLFFGIVKSESDGAFLTSPVLRLKACQKLTSWLTDIMGDDDENGNENGNETDDETEPEKKS